MRQATRRLVEEHGSQARLAERLANNPGQQSISKHLAGTPAGMHFAERIAALMHVDVNELLGRGEMSAHLSNRAPTLDRIEGYAAAEAAARAIAPRIPDAAWAKVRAMSGADVRVVDAEAVLGFARTWERVLAGQVQPYPDDGDVPPAPKKGGR